MSAGERKKPCMFYNSYKDGSLSKSINLDISHRPLPVQVTFQYHFYLSSYSLKCRSPSKETAVGAHSLAHIPLDMKNATRKAFLNDIFVPCIQGYNFYEGGRGGVLGL